MAQPNMLRSAISICLLLYICIFQSHALSFKDNNWLIDQLKEPIKEKRGKLERGSGDVDIDAFNENICGRANFRDWQLGESAMGCALKSQCGSKILEDDKFVGLNQNLNYSSALYRQVPVARISDGIRALPGEFPFFVQLKIDFGSKRYGLCGGTLIHKDIVLTAAHCVKDATGITVFLGSTRQDALGSLEVRAKNWCWLKKFRQNYFTGPQWDLAMIKLKDSVTYQSNKISPACLKAIFRHSSDALCSIAGLGKIDSNRLPINLLTLWVRRRCKIKRWDWKDRSCYEADRRGNSCVGDSGSPVVCYDKCGSANSTKAYVVGAVSAGPGDSCIPGKKSYQIIADFNLMRAEIMEILRVIKNDKSSSGIACARS